MDAWILVSSLVSVCLVICSLPVLFRLVPERHAIRVMLYLFLLGVLVASGIWIHRSHVLLLSTAQYSVGLLLVIAIYMACIVLFLFTVFSVFEASLTVWFLSEIARRQIGLSKNALFRVCGVRQIVQKRIDRMLDSGDIRQDGASYMLGTTQSYFRIRELVLETYLRIFP